MQLYQLKQNYQTIADYIDNADEIDEQTLFDTWESIDEAFDDKVISTAYVIRNNDADIETIANEIKRLTKLKRQKENANVSLKNYLKDNMLQLDKTKVKGDLFTVSVRNNAESVFISNEKQIPQDFVTYEPKIEKTKIKQAIKNGEHVAGAELVRTQSLSIR